MYIKKEQREKAYEPLITTLQNGLVAAVKARDRSLIGYVLLRSAVLAWIELGGGFNNGSDVKQIFQEVLDEISARVTHSLKKHKEKNGDIDGEIKVEMEVKKAEPTIVDTKGKELKTDKTEDK